MNEYDVADVEYDAADVMDAEQAAVYDRVGGLTWGTEVTADDLPGFYPVISKRGIIIDVLLDDPLLSPAEAAERFCFWDDGLRAYVADWVLGGILQVYLSYDASDWEEAFTIATHWVAMGYGDTEAIHWLNARVRHPDQATALRVAGLSPETLPRWTTGFRTDAQVQDLLDAAKAR